MRLSGLLYNRTKYSPEQWGPYDNCLLEKHWAIGSLALDYNSHSIIMHGPKYGTMTQWKGIEAHRWTPIGFPRAILILETQAYLLTFLRSVVEQIVCSSNASLVKNQTTMLDEAFQQGLKRSSGTFGYTLELASPYLNQPFSSPPSFDIDTLLDIAKTRQALQGDHLWLVQTDPLIQSSSGRSEIFDEIPKLKGLLTPLHEILDSRRPLWKVYDELLGALEALLLDQLQRRLQYLGSILPMRLRDTFRFSTFQRLESMAFYHTRRDLKLFPDFAKDMKELARMDEIMYAAFFDMAAINQMLEMVRFYRPRGVRREIDEITKDQYQATRLDTRTWEPSGTIPMREDGDRKIEAEKLLVKFTKEFIDTPEPSGTRLSQQWLDTDKQQRVALGRMWAQIRARHEQTLRRLGFEQEDVDCDLATLSADSTPDHIASIDIRNSEILAEIVARKAKKDCITRTSSVCSKVKTRKLNIADTDEELPFKISVDSDSIVSPPLEVPSTKVSVSKNSYAIFQTMFPTRNFEKRTKTVPWDSFVNAMVDAGFVASQSAGGSALQFEPDAISPWFG
ncbi:uncharacterized protein Bfra_012018 [Botrytis fragariae]|uniref:Uncharacterized protein n=1 Tax=Botrytis fragariae TaxID=1964551 RepID=A0A8H6AJ44_9HELO|nr:uncharacterized protein Bfra_012018 [Botrytis fragariae]KAF5868688.1 hypothetical protein Bfra_012018 [Botrytis fragariae]